MHWRNKISRYQVGALLTIIVLAGASLVFYLCLRARAPDTEPGTPDEADRGLLTVGSVRPAAQSGHR